MTAIEVMPTVLTAESVTRNNVLQGAHEHEMPWTIRLIYGPTDQVVARDSVSR